MTLLHKQCIAFPYTQKQLRLTEREIEVLGLVAMGFSNQEIADHLTIAEVAVRIHVNHILSKLHLANRVQATLYALKEELASLEYDEIEW